MTVSRSDGATLIGPATIALPPLSHRVFQNVLGGRAPSAGLRNARALVTCSGDFYAFAHLVDGASGEIGFIGPAASGTSLLAVPGPLACPAGAVCLDAPGIVHQPTPADPGRARALRRPGGDVHPSEAHAGSDGRAVLPGRAGRQAPRLLVGHQPQLQHARDAVLPRPRPRTSPWCATASACRTPRSSASRSPSRPSPVTPTASRTTTTWRAGSSRWSSPTSTPASSRRAWTALRTSPSSPSSPATSSWSTWASRRG